MHGLGGVAGAEFLAQGAVSDCQPPGEAPSARHRSRRPKVSQVKILHSSGCIRPQVGLVSPPRPSMHGKSLQGGQTIG